MHIVRVGRRFYNLEYLIVAEPADEADGGVLVVTMEAGKEFRLIGHEAEEFVDCLNQTLAPRRGLEPSSPGEVGRDVDIRSGDPLPRTPGGERKVGG